MFAGVARDCAEHLPNVVDNLARFASLYGEAAFVFAVSDSSDDSRIILERWLAAGRQGKVIDLGSLVAQLPQRTARIATARNACLAEIRSSGRSAYDHIVVADLDDVLASPLPAESFAEAASWLDGAPTRAGVFANATPCYYDIWALRHETWCPGDCWHAIWGRSPREPFEAAKFREVYSRQIELPSWLPPIRVRSAFGGLGIYKIEYALGARYCGLDGEGTEVSEHVAFNDKIGQAGGQLHLFPGLMVQAPAEHIYRASSVTLWWRLKMARRRMSEMRMPPWQALVGPQQHQEFGSNGIKALILDPALHSMGGHHYSALLSLKIELSKLGVDHVSLGSAFADDWVVGALGVKPSFSRSVYGRVDWTSREFLQSVTETARQLSRALRWQLKAPDLLILPCCDQVLALALAGYLHRRRLWRVPHIVMWLLYAPDYKKAIDDPSVANHLGEYRQAFAALRRSVSDDNKIAVYCETTAMAEAYREVIGLEIKVAPGPNLVTARDAVKEPRQGRSPIVACVGHANAPKGYRLLPGAIERVLRARSDVNFMIHGSMNDLDVERDASIFEVLSGMGPRVIVHHCVLSHEEYLSWLKQADLLLLPYDPLVYRTRGSGVFTEATTLGIPVVATRGCGFARPAFDEGRAVEITEYSSSGVAEAILNAVDRLDDLTTRAMAASKTSSYEGGVESILQSSLKAIRDERQSGAGSLLGRVWKRNRHR